MSGTINVKIEVKEDQWSDGLWEDYILTDDADMDDELFMEHLMSRYGTEFL